MTQKNAPYAIGQQLEVVIENVLPYAVFVRLEDGSTGYIHRRDVAWGGIRDPREVVHAGQVVPAIVMELPTSERSLRLSLKDTTPDPWDSFVKEKTIGQLVHGVVKSLEPFGAFVEILPGVDGLITCDQLTNRPIDKPEDIVWVGDQVEAVITRINHKERHVRLSMRQRIQQIDTATDVWQRIQPESQASLTDPPHEPVPTPVPVLTPTLGPVLILENEVEICEPLVRHLNHVGYTALGAIDFNMAREALGQRSYAVLVVDIQVDRTDGLDFVTEMAAQLEDTAVVVMSSPDILAARSADIERVGAIAVVPKPFDAADVVSVLRQIETGELIPWRAEAPPESVSEDETLMVPYLPASGTLDKRLVHVLHALLDTTQAHKAIIFHLDPISNKVSIIADAGRQTFNSGALNGLLQSPVGDVIREQRPILENHAHTPEKRKQFEKLSPLLHFCSCIGAPLPLQTNPDYSLFLFHNDPGAFHRYRVRDAQASAALAATIVEQDHFAQRMQQLNSLLLGGQVAAGLRHEVNNKLSIISLKLRNLHTDCGNLPADVPGLAVSEAYQQMQETLTNVMETVRDLRKTTELFQELMHLDGMGLADVGEALWRTEAVIAALAAHHNVTIMIDESGDLPRVRGDTIALHQVLLNLMLNAVQHISTIRPSNGVIRIGTEPVHVEGQSFLRIEVMDNGPGIHRSLWDDVFKLGYTTRDEGSGQGLYIARSLVEAFGGRLYIESSPIQLGTTFQIELLIVT